MNVLFEEDGAFKAGTVLADNTTSLQVETGSGKRVKVKAANVLLRFAAPAPGELVERAEAAAEGIETEFLWEVCPEAEFGFEELGAGVFRPGRAAGRGGGDPAAPACRADLLPPQGQGPLPQGAAGDPQGGAGRAGEEAPAGAGHRAHGQ